MGWRIGDHNIRHGLRQAHPPLSLNATRNDFHVSIAQTLAKRCKALLEANSRLGCAYIKPDGTHVVFRIAHKVNKRVKDGWTYHEVEHDVSLNTFTVLDEAAKRVVHGTSARYDIVSYAWNAKGWKVVER